MAIVIVLMSDEQKNKKKTWPAFSSEEFVQQGNLYVSNRGSICVSLRRQFFIFMAAAQGESVNGCT